LHWHDVTAGLPPCDPYDWIVANPPFHDGAKADPAGVLAAAVPYLNLAVTVCGGWQMGRAALAAARKLAAGEGDDRFLTTKIACACFYADHVLPHAAAYGESVRAGAGALATGAAESF